MPITRRQSARLISAQGFSLIELLVVLMIVGLMSSLVVLNLSTDNRSEQPAEITAGQLAGAMRLGRSEAILRTTPMAIYRHQSNPDEPGEKLGWLAWQSGQWVAADMKDFQMPKDMTVQWLKPLASQKPRVESASSRQQDIVPAIVFYPTGEITEFALRLGDVTVLLDAFGKVRVINELNHLPIGVEG